MRVFLRHDVRILDFDGVTMFLIEATGIISDSRESEYLPKDSRECDSSREHSREPPIPVAFPASGFWFTGVFYCSRE